MLLNTFDVFCCLRRVSMPNHRYFAHLCRIMAYRFCRIFM